MEEEDYLYYEDTTYLGKSGITGRCQDAMTAILTSAFLPEKITAVIRNTDTYHDEMVLFLVWHWAGQNVTIIPDGFGTHGGAGGTGLSIVLGLIKFYNIPLQQVWMPKETFNQLAKGALTEEIFIHICRFTTEYNWDFYPIRDVKKVKSGQGYFLEAQREDGNKDFSVLLP